MSEAILITGNAGQGKTTVAANLATVMARFGHPTLLANADKLTPKLHYHFGIQIPNGVVYSHASGLEAKFSCIDQLPNGSRLKIVDVPTYDLKWYKTGHPTIIVTKPDFPSILDALKLKKTIPNVIGLILNQAENDAYELTPGNIQHFTGLPIIGVVPYENTVRQSTKLGHPVTDLHPDKPITTVIKKIAANLMNQEYYTGRK